MSKKLFLEGYDDTQKKVATAHDFRMAPLQEAETNEEEDVEQEQVPRQQTTIAGFVETAYIDVART